MRAISGGLMSVAEASRIAAQLPRRGVLGPLREPLQSLPLRRGELAYEHLWGTHGHLLGSHASRFDVKRQFPVERYESPH
jgi:hypothetical protein